MGYTRSQARYLMLSSTMLMYLVCSLLLRRSVNHLSLPLTFVHPLVPLPLLAPLESSAFSGFSSTLVTAVMILRASPKLCPSIFLFLTCTAASPSNRSPQSSHSCSCKSSHSALFISPIKVFLSASTIIVYVLIFHRRISS